MTKGYSMAEGEKNLLVCIGFTGQITHNGTTNYRVTNEELCEIFGTKGLKAIQAKHLDSTYLNGIEWNITKFLNKPIMVPTRNTLYQNYKGETSLSFNDYENILLEQEENEETVEIKMLHFTEEIENDENEPSWLQTLRKREEHFAKSRPIKDKYNEEWEFIETYFSSKGKKVNTKKVLTLKYYGEDIEDQILDLELPVEANFKNQKPILQIIREYESQQEKIFMNATPENPNPTPNPNQNPSAPTRSEIEENSKIPRTFRVFGSRTYQLGGRHLIPQATLEYRGENRERIQFGKRMEIDPNQLPTAKQQGTILGLPSWNPQHWAKIINQCERDACRAWINRSMDGEMFEFLETLLGPTIEFY
ncbi:hypothetical protein SLE2022_133600 [Rubroshorea leprosula]